MSYEFAAISLMATSGPSMVLGRNSHNGAINTFVVIVSIYNAVIEKRRTYTTTFNFMIDCRATIFGRIIVTASTPNLSPVGAGAGAAAVPRLGDSSAKEPAGSLR